MQSAPHGGRGQRQVGGCPLGFKTTADKNIAQSLRSGDAKIDDKIRVTFQRSLDVAIIAFFWRLYLHRLTMAATQQAKAGLEATPTELGDTPKVPDRFADESFKLFSKVEVSDPTPEEAKRIRNKCLWRILPFLCIGYHLMYVDKQTVRQQIAQVLRFFHSNHEAAR